MNQNNRLQSIQSRLEELKSLDTTYQIFGSENHKYELNPLVSNEEVKEFESHFNIELPDGYRQFITTLGNGGAGPYYGLESLGDSLFVDLDYKRKDELLDPSEPFLLTTPWNMDFQNTESLSEEEYETFEEEYFDDKWVNGLLRVANFGCGVYMNLVVNGEEYGNIWVDDRGNDGGIYPDPYFEQQDRTDFLNWYELWLNQSITELKND